MSLIQVIPDVTQSNVTSSNNLLLISYFKILTVELHVQCVFNIHANWI